MWYFDMQTSTQFSSEEVKKSTQEVKNLREKLLDLREKTGRLDLTESRRKELLNGVSDFADKALGKLQGSKTRIYTGAGDANNNNADSKGIRSSPIQDEPLDLDDILDLYGTHVESRGLRAGHGGHMAYVPNNGVFPSALGDFLADTLCTYAGRAYESPGGVEMDNMLLEWLAGVFGYPKGFRGNLTSGGSAATVIAMATARDSRKGLRARDFHRVVVYVSELTHHCMRKALHTIGLGEAIVREIPVDSRWKMDVQTLETTVEKDAQNGLIPFAVVATVGTTDVGSADPVDAIADVAERYGLWLHVDAAYGGFFALCEDTRPLFRGVERSDSIIVDPHKGLNVPYGSGVVLVRNGPNLHLSNTAHKQGGYLYHPGSDDTELSPCDLSFELSTHFRGPRMWFPLKLFGVEAFRSMLTEKLQLATYFYNIIKDVPGFEVLQAPELSVVAFRYTEPPSGMDANSFNKLLLEEMIQEGGVYLSSTTLKGTFYLRICVLGFRTHVEHVELCLEILQKSLRKLKTGMLS
ncbi:PREDICTED: tyrosine decarboxylase 2-like [Branchiostoma belcheri]|uniref:Tyrosine decarboxylase 2-like n=1 Tax=Branchiostoma belcheri TaxID=7741 RepID=A0A6P4Y485_BRABE|nr:PREDICTED: tyrosine decarboxylase 2-like [Branchiostoma belcheri]